MVRFYWLLNDDHTFVEKERKKKTDEQNN